MRGEELSFRLTGENWELEFVHLSGQLYEAIEVEHLVKLVPNGAFLDVGGIYKARCNRYSY